MTLARALEAFEANSRIENGQLRVDWRPIWDVCEFVNESGLLPEDVWAGLAEAWLTRLGSTLQYARTFTRLPGFYFLAREKLDEGQPIVRIVRGMRRHVLASLSGIAKDPGYALAVIVFDAWSEFDAYVEQYTGEGTAGRAEGIFIHMDVAHLVVRGLTAIKPDVMFAHELTHAYLLHLPLPLWLDEGLACSTSHKAIDWKLDITEETGPRHHAHWNEMSAQAFWSGKAFHDDDPEVVGLAYELAEWFTDLLSVDAVAFREFANLANHSDGGEAAAQEVYGRSLGELFNGFLGAGDFTPRPEAWSEPTE
jgi:hypothetical protein